MKTKYQIFISSTFEDLKQERDIAIKAILEMGHIPVGMEMFSAGDEEQWELIKRQIDDSDYYLVILAHSYGSMDGKISYTEKEYDYAISSKLPALGFVIDKDAPWPSSKMETDNVKKAALEKFKQKVMRKIVNKWNNSDQIHALVSISLSKAFTAYPRPGWVRSTTSLTPEIANELGRLSKENAELRTASGKAALELRREQHDSEENQKIIDLLRGNKKAIYIKGEGTPDWKKGLTVSLYQIFEDVAPVASAETSTSTLAKLFSVSYRGKVKVNSSTNWPVPKNLVGEVLANFRALGLLEPSNKKHAVNDKEEYWSLTNKGERIHSAAIIENLRRNLSEAAATSSDEASTPNPE
jgi:hypothetical protein